MMTRWVKELGIGVLASCLLALLRLTSTDLCSALGEKIGSTLGKALGGFWPPDGKAAKNLHLLGVPASLVKEQIEHSRKHCGRTIFEYAVLHRLWREGRIEIRGRDVLEEAVKSGRPVILMGLHTSNWEVIGPAVIGLGYRFSAVYRVPRNRYMHSLAVSVRRKYGAHLLAQGHEGASGALRAAADCNTLLLMYADDLVDGVVQAPQFGRNIIQRGNIKKIVYLSMLNRALILPTYASRTCQANFRVTFDAAISLTGDVLSQEDRAANLLLVDGIVERCIRANLNEWYLLPLLEIMSEPTNEVKL